MDLTEIAKAMVDCAERLGKLPTVEDRKKAVDALWEMFFGDADEESWQEAFRDSEGDEKEHYRKETPCSKSPP